MRGFLAPTLYTSQDKAKFLNNTGKGYLYNVPRVGVREAV